MRNLEDLMKRYGIAKSSLSEFIFLARRLLPLRWEMNDGSPNLRKQLIANKWYICYN